MTSSTTSSRFRSIDGTVCYLSGDLAAIRSLRSGEVRVVGRQIGDIFLRCVAERSLDGHIRAAVGGDAGADHESVRSAVFSMVLSGLLVPVDQFPKHQAGPPAQVATMVVVSADRPEQLGRCLESYGRHWERHGRRVSLVVVDGSREGDNARLNRQQIGRHKSNFDGVSYLGKEARDLLRETVAAYGLPAATVSWLVMDPPPAYSAGAVRNMSLLATAGRPFLTVDDDTLANVWLPEDLIDGIRIVGHGDLRESHFFETRAAALSSVTPTQTCLLDYHERLLGRSITDVASQPGTSLVKACSHQRFALADGSQNRVRLTWSGIVGDGAVYCPFRILFAEGEALASASRDNATLRLALGSREVRRTVRQTSVTDDQAFMTYCACIDNTAVTVPFSPTGFNEDGLFACLLRACDTGAFIGHVTVGVVHDSTRPSSYAKNDGPMSARHLRMCDFVMALAGQWRRSEPEPRGHDGIVSLGRYFQAWGRLSRPSFRNGTIDAALQLKASALRRCDDILDKDGVYPPYVKNEVSHYRDVLLKSIKEPTFWLPLEQQDGDAASGAAGMQAHIRTFGEGLEAWPELWDRCRRAPELFRPNIV